MPAYHSMTAAQALESVQSSERGISEQEAQKRLLSYGENALRNKKKGGRDQAVFGAVQGFHDHSVDLCGGHSGTVAYFTGDAHEVADTGILLFIILLNTIVGFIQQYRADTAVEKLKKLSVCQVKVLRGGKDMLLPGTQLVPGDVIWLEEGDMVPADCRILQSEDLRCDESALTGESNGVAKTPNPCEEKSAMADRKCMLYSSSFVLKGQAKALVVKTGQDTELGKIAGMLTQTKEAKTPLEKILATLGKVITVFVISVAAVIFVFGIFFKENSLLSNFMSSVAIAVAAIPEGMPAIVTVIMALGVQRMSKQRAIIRKLHAVETLGGCSCICSDKTGTLTENRMTVEEIVVDFRAGTPLAGDPLKSGHPAVRPLLECMRICNTVKGKGGKHIGDPTEVALVRYADSCAFFTDFRRLGGIPFTSERKMMTVSAQTPQGRKNYVKGGADVLLGKCTRIWTQGGIRAITQKDREEILSVTKELASRALRVLGFACSEYSGKPAEENLIFLGVCGMIDPPKQGVKEAVSQCMRAGIMPVMITGDHRDTAFAIAKRLGIAQSEEQVLTGTELDTLPEEVLNKQIPKTRVFARVSPKHKSAIVERFQKAGNVVAMTGGRHQRRAGDTQGGYRHCHGNFGNGRHAQCGGHGDRGRQFFHDRFRRAGRQAHFFKHQKDHPVFPGDQSRGSFVYSHCVARLVAAGISHLHAASLDQPDHGQSARPFAGCGSDGARLYAASSAQRGDLYEGEHDFGGRVRHPADDRLSLGVCGGRKGLRKHRCRNDDLLRPFLSRTVSFFQHSFGARERLFQGLFLQQNAVRHRVCGDCGQSSSLLVCARPRRV